MIGLGFFASGLIIGAGIPLIVFELELDRIRKTTNVVSHLEHESRFNSEMGRSINNLQTQINLRNQEISTLRARIHEFESASCSCDESWW